MIWKVALFTSLIGFLGLPFIMHASIFKKIICIFYLYGKNANKTIKCHTLHNLFCAGYVQPFSQLWKYNQFIQPFKISNIFSPKDSAVSDSLKSRVRTSLFARAVELVILVKPIGRIGNLTLAWAPFSGQEFSHYHSNISTVLRIIKINVESLALKSVLILLVLIINLRPQESFQIEHLKPELNKQIELVILLRF